MNKNYVDLVDKELAKARNTLKLNRASFIIALNPVYKDEIRTLLNKLKKSFKVNEEVENNLDKLFENEEWLVSSEGYIISSKNNISNRLYYSIHELNELLDDNGIYHLKAKPSTDNKGYSLISLRKKELNMFNVWFKEAKFNRELTGKFVEFNKSTTEKEDNFTVGLEKAPVSYQNRKYINVIKEMGFGVQVDVDMIK